MRWEDYAITDTFTPGQSASWNSQGSPTTSSAARSSSKLATVRTPNRVDTTNSASEPGRWTIHAIPGPSALRPAPSTQNGPCALLRQEFPVKVLQKDADVRLTVKQFLFLWV